MSDNQNTSGDGRLTNRQRDDAQQWIQEHWHNESRCSICGQRRFSIGDHFVTSPVYMPNGGLAIGGPSYPQIMFICMNCGHTLFINAVQAGVISG